MSVTGRGVFYEVDTYGGPSGAPVGVHPAEDSQPIAVGIHAYGGRNAGEPRARRELGAADHPRVLEKLTERVEQDGGWPAGGGA